MSLSSKLPKIPNAKAFWILLFTSSLLPKMQDFLGSIEKRWKYDLFKKGSGDMKAVKRMLMFFCIIAILPLSLSCAGSKKTENVFDQLYYEVRSVKKGKDSILLTGTETAFADYGFGLFENIQIPDLDMCLDFDDKSLYILFFNHSETENWDTSFCVLYRYDIDDKKLYGEQSLEYLNDNFLSYYFEWCNGSNETNVYSLQNLGNYTFIPQEQVNYN